MARLDPLGVFVVVKPDSKEPFVTASGVHVVHLEDKDIRRQVPTNRGVVVALAASRSRTTATATAQQSVSGLSVGDHVVYLHYEGCPVDLEGESFVVLQESDIVARIL